MHVTYNCINMRVCFDTALISYQGVLLLLIIYFFSYKTISLCIVCGYNTSTFVNFSSYFEFFFKLHPVSRM